MKNYDIIIIGGGIAGASLAFMLARNPAAKSLRILLIEGEAFPGYHTTGRSAALYTTLYGSRVVRTLTRSSEGFLRNPHVGFAEHPLLTRRGALHLANDADAWQLIALAEDAERHGEAVQFLDFAGAREHVPALRPGATARALYVPEVWDIDVNALHQGFLRGAKGAGVTVEADAKLLSLNGKQALGRLSLQPE